MEVETNVNKVNATDINRVNDNLESNTNKAKQKRRPHIYSKTENLNILKEVAANRPFGDDSLTTWNEIHERLQINVADGFALKRHFETLLKGYKISNRVKLNGSGTDEDYCEETQLFQNIVEFLESQLLSEENRQEELLKSKRQKESSDKKAAQKIRKCAMETIHDRESQDTEPQNEQSLKKKKVDLNKILQEREKANIQIEQDKLKLKKEEIELAKEEQVLKYDLERKRLALEEKRLSQMCKEYEDKREFEKLKMEMEERRLMLSALGKCMQNNSAHNLE